MQTPPHTEQEAVMAEAERERAREQAGAFTRVFILTDVVLITFNIVWRQRRNRRNTFFCVCANTAKYNIN